MAAEEIIYRANRAQVTLFAVGAVVLGAVSFYLPQMNSLSASDFHDWRPIFYNTPAAWKWHAIGLILVPLGLASLRFVFDNRVIWIDDTGISRMMIYGRRSGRWQDFTGVSRTKVRFFKMFTLRFKRSTAPVSSRGATTSLVLPGRLLGIDNDLIMNEVALRLARLESRSRPSHAAGPQAPQPNGRGYVPPAAAKVFGRRA